jgi:hypothetical protein
MNRTKTEESLDLGLPPEGGDLMASNSLADEAHALRVMLDRSENMKVTVGQTLLRLLTDRFAGNRSALRDWYEAEVVEGKAHRTWSTVEKYMGTVRVHGVNAATIIAEREDAKREYKRDQYSQRRDEAAAFRRETSLADHIDKSDYDRRADWLAQMNYHWFKGDPEWQNKWLLDRGLRRV